MVSRHSSLYRTMPRGVTVPAHAFSTQALDGPEEYPKHLPFNPPLILKIPVCGTSSHAALICLAIIYNFSFFHKFLFLHLLRNLGVVLLEALAHALLRSHPLEDAAVEASGFLG